MQTYTYTNSFGTKPINKADNEAHITKLNTHVKFCQKKKKKD